MKWPDWLPRFFRDDAERVAPTRYLDSSAPTPAIGPKRVRAERWLRDPGDDAERFVRGRGRGSYSPSDPPAVAVNGRKIKQVIPVSLATARDDQEYAVSGNIVIYNDSTNGTDRIQVRLARSTGEQAPQLTLRPGQEVGGEYFRTLLISNSVIAGATAELWVCEDNPPADPFTYQ